MNDKKIAREPEPFFGCEPSSDIIEKRIYTIRNNQVMIDLDLANIYGIENRSLRQAVRRNIDKFPEDFMFRLSQNEANELIINRVSQNVIPSRYNTGGAEMFAFTEHGVAMLATILKSPNAKTISIAIIRAFVSMRHFLWSNSQVFLRLERIEYKQFETDQNSSRFLQNWQRTRLNPSKASSLTDRYMMLTS